VNDLQIQGTVDRVEIYRRGEDIYFAVADYKTGTPPGRKDIREGTSLQLMIYLEVMRHKLAEHYEVALDRVKPVGGLYYRLDARNVDTKTTAIFVPNELKKDVINLRASKYDPDTVEELEQIIDDVFVRANEYVEGIATGRFHVTTRDVNEVCRGCEYQAVCRVRLVGLERSS
jgi:ATP-dependent helicase/DNAse subunit B